jgi:hypothetical protein
VVAAGSLVLQAVRENSIIAAASSAKIFLFIIYLPLINTKKALLA